MSNNKNLKRFLPAVVRNYLNAVQSRLDRLELLDATVKEIQITVSNLETAIDTLIETPRHTPEAGAGFNWQSGRKRIFTELLEACQFQVIVETGTWIGNTTGYMAEVSQLPILSTEVDRRFHSLARMRLADVQNASLFNRDSREFIGELSTRSDLADARIFFYLDAHWYSDLPLREEIDIIARHWKDAMIMVDDFQVPGDEGYGYDDYGDGKALTLDYLRPSIALNDLVPFFPSTPSAEETGLKRGCVVLVKRGPLDETLGRLPSLERYHDSSAALR